MCLFNRKSKICNVCTMEIKTKFFLTAEKCFGTSSQIPGGPWTKIWGNPLK